MLTKTSLIAFVVVSLSSISSVLTTPATSTTFVKCDTDTLKTNYKDHGKITYEHGPKKVTSGKDNYFSLTNREYFMRIDETQPFNATGYWKYTDSQGKEQVLSVSQPSRGSYTIIEFDNGRKNTKQAWVWSLAANKIYPTSASDYNDVKGCTTCFTDENNEIVAYMRNSTGRSLPTLKQCDALDYWTGFALPTPTGGPEPVSDITTFEWNNGKERIKVVFKICPNGKSCNFKSSSAYYIRIQSASGSLVFWMTQDKTIANGITGTGLQSQDDREYTYKKDFTGYKPALPDFLRKGLKGEKGSIPLKVTVTHCWLKDGSQTELECSPIKEKKIARSDDGAAKK